ncbi:1203_t:CDS:2 [Paraglomus occultum]|uniref:1203_t:CDS:1 n=1 Tax=Paraglomus occultum TaxID=144539 RepID=A0A9N8Z6B4_9GLOM|nr:1203_t:CDS:2 [Paraglomus occultum]
MFGVEGKPIEPPHCNSSPLNNPHNENGVLQGNGASRPEEMSFPNVNCLGRQNCDDGTECVGSPNNSNVTASTKEGKIVKFMFGASVRSGIRTGTMIYENNHSIAMRIQSLQPSLGPLRRVGALAGNAWTKEKPKTPCRLVVPNVSSVKARIPETMCNVPKGENQDESREDCYGRVFEWESMDDVLWSFGDYRNEATIESRTSRLIWVVELDGIVEFEDVKDGDLNKLKPLGLQTIALPKKLPQLVENGLNLLNISLDTLDPTKFELITGLNQVIKTIDQAISLGLRPMKVNCVVKHGINDQEVAIDLSTSVSDNTHDTSKAYYVPGFAGRIGFITSMSDHFYGTCNRLRITADGNLKVCLFGNTKISLRDLTRQNVSEKQLLEIIEIAVRNKKKQHTAIDIVSHSQLQPTAVLSASPNTRPLYFPLHFQPSK